MFGRTKEFLWMVGEKVAKKGRNFFPLSAVLASRWHPSPIAGLERVV
jgi:hypothetical protein